MKLNFSRAHSIDCLFQCAKQDSRSKDRYALFSWDWKCQPAPSAEMSETGVYWTMVHFHLRDRIETPVHNELWCHLLAKSSQEYYKWSGKNRASFFLLVFLLWKAFCLRSLSKEIKAIIDPKAQYKQFFDFSFRRWPEHWGGLCGWKAGGSVLQLSVRRPVGIHDILLEWHGSASSLCPGCQLESIFKKKSIVFFRWLLFLCLLPVLTW